MKKFLLFLCVLVTGYSLKAQITSPIIKANFGVDADLRANYFDGFAQAGNDDWFRTTGTTGAFIIDTTGAAYIVNRYGWDANFRKVPFWRGMRYPQFSVVNGMMLIDGIFIRDHHGDDSTVFASGSNKNGMSPVSWSTPVSQGIPDKNDILDMFMHVRRQGPNSADSLWLFGGVSIENTTGNRYFDFEMYQTDIYYDKPSLSFKGYGPDAGHTAWQFDAAGNVLKAGDIIFTAEYSSSSLSAVEARIWVHQSARSLTPSTFAWGTEFDGANSGAVYGYANILPKTAGTFYTGLQCSNNTWAGPFSVVRQDNSIATNYSAKQFMEFSVNLSKLGLDPYLITMDPCQMPFRRILVKSRASTSFTAELKDFVGPFSFFRAPMAQASADIPFYCGVPGVSVISVNNPLPTSLYTWSTIGGNIVSDTVGPDITVNQAGQYIVTQSLMDSCGTSYAKDTVTIVFDPGCTVLKSYIDDVRAAHKDGVASIAWKVLNNSSARYFDVERSAGSGKFVFAGRVNATAKVNEEDYAFNDLLPPVKEGQIVFYRIKITDENGNTSYSKVVGVSIDRILQPKMELLSNPVAATPTIAITALKNTTASIALFDQSGKKLYEGRIGVQRGVNVTTLNGTSLNTAGMYFIKVKMDEQQFAEKFIKF